MSPRPSVSVVMPFAGSAAAATRALAALAALRVEDGDQRILADNAQIASSLPLPAGIEIVDVPGERSPAHARNAGARAAHGEWLLFLDADCLAPGDLLDRYFLDGVDDAVGALAGEIVPVVLESPSLAERYGSARSFLGQAAHLAHRYLPRAAAANLLVRRAAFEQLGGFYEGVRAAEDTDFSWRLQRAGWRLELRVAARVEHRYRASVGELRRQWRGYAAGRAWLGRRYDGFTPEPAAARALGRLRARHRGGTPGAFSTPRVQNAPRVRRTRSERAAFLALDALLAGEELAGLLLSNRPAGTVAPPTAVVLVAEHFPAPGDPLVEFAMSVERVRVEVGARPERLADVDLRIDYREDDGTIARLAACTRLALRHPLRCLRDRLARPAGAPSLLALASAVARLQADPAARVHGLGGASAHATAARLAALSGADHALHLGRGER